MLVACRLALKRTMRTSTHARNAGRRKWSLQGLPAALARLPALARPAEADRRSARRTSVIVRGHGYDIARRSSWRGTLWPMEPVSTPGAPPKPMRCAPLREPFAGRATLRAD
jgi:hypothetical protein